MQLKGKEIKEFLGFFFKKTLEYRANMINQKMWYIIYLKSEFQ